MFLGFWNLVDGLVISIWIISYQVVLAVRKNGRMVVRARIFPINYQIWPKMKQKMNGMQKIIYEGKYDIIVITIWFISHEDVYKFLKNLLSSQHQSYNF